MPVNCLRRVHGVLGMCFKVHSYLDFFRINIWTSEMYGDFN